MQEVLHSSFRHSWLVAEGGGYSLHWMQSHLRTMKTMHCNSLYSTGCDLQSTRVKYLEDLKLKYNQQTTPLQSTFSILCAMISITDPCEETHRVISVKPLRKMSNLQLALQKGTKTAGNILLSVQTPLLYEREGEAVRGSLIQ